MIALVALASCSKSEAQVPEQSNQWVTITASCESCSIEIQASDGVKTFHFGGWISYTYQNVTGQDTAYAKLYVPIDYTRSQELYLQINEIQFGKSVNKRHVINSYLEDGKREEPYALELNLPLKQR